MDAAVVTSVAAPEDSAFKGQQPQEQQQYVVLTITNTRRGHVIVDTEALFIPFKGHAGADALHQAAAHVVGEWTLGGLPSCFFLYVGLSP